MFFSADGKFSSKKIEKFTDSRDYGSNFFDGKWLKNAHHHKNDEDYCSKMMLLVTISQNLKIH